jgi:hypothetical protein
LKRDRRVTKHARRVGRSSSATRCESSDGWQQKRAPLRLLHMRDEIESLSNELVGLDFESYRESYET